MKYILLLIPCVLSVATPLFNTIEPTVFGFPFFYVFLLTLVPVSSLFIYCASKIGGK